MGDLVVEWAFLSRLSLLAVVVIATSLRRLSKLKLSRGTTTQLDKATSTQPEHPDSEGNKERRERARTVSDRHDVVFFGEGIEEKR